jgi:hypothetical protein
MLLEYLLHAWAAGEMSVTGHTHMSRCFLSAASLESTDMRRAAAGGELQSDGGRPWQNATQVVLRLPIYAYLNQKLAEADRRAGCQMRQKERGESAAARQ